jgi:hypothetical protein
LLELVPLFRGCGRQSRNSAEGPEPGRGQRQGGAISDLNDLVPDDSGWTITRATAINDLGQIVGYGMIDGNEHAFLLTPVPEPATLSLLALGGAALVRRRRVAPRTGRP